MKSLSLDFLITKKKSTPVEWGMVAIVLIALFAVGIIAFQINNKKIEIEASLNKLIEPRQARIKVSGLSAENEKQAKDSLAIAKKIAWQLNVPWESLFSSLEATKNKDVALLEILPDPASLKVRINGESRDYSSLMNYIRTLWEIETLTNVYLVRYKIDEKNPDHPVLFSLEALWKI